MSGLNGATQTIDAAERKSMSMRTRLPLGGPATANLAVVGLMMLAGPAFGHASRAFAQAPAAVSQAGVSPGPNGANPPGANGQTAGQAPQPAAGESDKERLAVNPVTGITIVSAANYVPLTGTERWKLYWKQNYFSVGAYFGPVLASLVLDQAVNSPPEWGAGFAGYERRLASRTGNAVIQGTAQAAMAAILHEDVRYIPGERERGARRALHAIEYTFLTYNRRGHPTPNIANVGAYFASTAVSTTWQPRKDSVAAYTLTNTGAQIALAAAVNVLQEFWPELTGWRKHRR